MRSLNALRALQGAGDEPLKLPRSPQCNLFWTFHSLPGLASGTSELTLSRLTRSASAAHQASDRIEAASFASASPSWGSASRETGWPGLGLRWAGLGVGSNSGSSRCRWYRHVLRSGANARRDSRAVARGGIARGPQSFCFGGAQSHGCLTRQCRGIACEECAWPRGALGRGQRLARERSSSNGEAGQRPRDGVLALAWCGCQASTLPRRTPAEHALTGLPTS